uniref:Cleavage/polyadenylation specificity factor A subunit C-terminal domain-containing protein n=1 Tax=Romanomermis culicivorax TaxID=13658 RepID=A0A915L1Q3_ROMCU
MGQKVYIWSFKDNDLVGISFLDLQIYIHQMISIRNLTLVGDVFRSVCLLRYQEDCKALSLASRDPRHMEVYAVEFMVDNNQLGFLASDADGNIHMFSYQPEAKESFGGQRLVKRADINVGTRINSFVRLRCHVGDPPVERKLEAAYRHVVYFGTTDGSFGSLLPLPEKNYRRLLMLQSVLVSHLEHAAGLNPRSYRVVRQAGYISSGSCLMNAQKNILDGDLLTEYLRLSATERYEIAKRIGTTREQLLDDLLEISRSITQY